jgi:ribonuclease E
MFDDDYDDDGYDPIEPFSEDEFVTHSKRELRNLDAGRDESDDGDDEDEDFDDDDLDDDEDEEEDDKDD